jgi:hypothetical protein
MPPSDAESKTWQPGRPWVLGLVTLLALAFLASFFPIEDSDDDWWHLKAGKLLWEGKIGWYSDDPFTLTAQDKMWVNHEWLAETLFYGAHHWGGLNAANLLKSIIVMAAFGMAYFSSLKAMGPEIDRAAKVQSAALAVCLAIPTAQFTFYLRPPVWSYLFLAVYQFLFLRIQREPHSFTAKSDISRILLLGSLMVLWANLHGGAILGCVVMVLMAGGAALDWLTARRLNREASYQSVIGWAMAALVVLAASCLNPYGIHLHALTFEVMSEKWLTGRIYELFPPAFDLIWTLPLLLIPAAFGVLRGRGWGERLVFLFLVWQGMSHVRHLPLLAIWSAPYAALGIATAMSRESAFPTNTYPGGKRCGLIASAMLIAIGIMVVGTLWPVLPPLLAMSAGRYAVVGLLVCIAIAFVALKWRGASTFFWISAAIAIGFVVTYPGARPARCIRCLSGESWSGKNFPDQLADFILDHHLTSPALLSRETGAGMLIWKLSPETMRVFTCSRFDLQGGIPIKELETLLWMFDRPWRDPDSGVEIPAWQTLWNEKYHFDLVLLEKYNDLGKVFPLWNYLDGPDSWFVRVAAEAWPDRTNPDHQYTLFMRKGEALSDLMKEIGQPAWFDENDR